MAAWQHLLTLRYIAWSHFESDECGALNDWLEIAPQAEPVCTLVGKLVSVDDLPQRPARGMTADDVLETGKYRFRFHHSPHIPHGWDAGVLNSLAELKPETLAVMHGSSYAGQGERLLGELAEVIRENF